MKTKSTTLSTSGSADLFQRFLKAASWDSNQDARPDSISVWHTIELLESVKKELVAYLHTDNTNISFESTPWIEKIEAMRTFGKDVIFKVIVREDPKQAIHQTVVAKIQISLDHLRKIIYNAETAKRNDSSLSETLIFELDQETDSHLGSDITRVTLKSGYQECNGREIW
jgi:hypothetical protein